MGIADAQGGCTPFGLREASDRLEQAWATAAQPVRRAAVSRSSRVAIGGTPGVRARLVRSRQPGDYWSALDVSQSSERINVPALHISGWFDTYLKGTIDAFVALCERAAPVAREQSIPDRRTLGSHSLGRPHRRSSTSARRPIDTDTILLRWFNHWLKDSGEFAHEPRIRHFVLFENRWHSAEDWSAGTESTLYLHSDGRANSRKGDGTPQRSRRLRRAMRHLRLRPGGSGACARRPGSDSAGRSIRPRSSWATMCSSIPPRPCPGAGGIWLAACRCTVRRRRRRTDFTAKLVRVRPDGAPTSSASVSRALTFSLAPAFTPTRFITGNSNSSRPRADLRPATAFVSRSPAAPFRFTTAIPEAACLRRWQRRGTGPARRNSSITTRRGHRLCIFRCGATKHERA